MSPNKNNSLSNKNLLLAAFASICFVLFFVGGPGYYSPRSYKHFWDLGHILKSNSRAWNIRCQPAKAENRLYR
jgi:hypothetical protein